MTYKQKDLKIALKCVTTSEKLGFYWKKSLKNNQPHYYYHRHHHAHWNQEMGQLFKIMEFW